MEHLPREIREAVLEQLAPAYFLQLRLVSKQMACYVGAMKQWVDLSTLFKAILLPVDMPKTLVTRLIHDNCGNLYFTSSRSRTVVKITDSDCQSVIVVQEQPTSTPELLCAHKTDVFYSIKVKTKQKGDTIIKHRILKLTPGNNASTNGTSQNEQENELLEEFPSKLMIVQNSDVIVSSVPNTPDSSEDVGAFVHKYGRLPKDKKTYPKRPNTQERLRQIRVPDAMCFDTHGNLILALASGEVVLLNKHRIGGDMNAQCLCCLGYRPLYMASNYLGELLVATRGDKLQTVPFDSASWQHRRGDVSHIDANGNSTVVCTYDVEKHSPSSVVRGVAVDQRGDFYYATSSHVIKVYRETKACLRLKISELPSNTRIHRLTCAGNTLYLLTVTKTSDGYNQLVYKINVAGCNVTIKNT
mmetsp:Transcript_9774/g.10839  ORF Transcript_9774/g.10839 Transcript_9774/m.10839 type:complete len:414 (-) Transcript_9774:47-1288(-)